MGRLPRIQLWKTKLKVSGSFRTTTGADGAVTVTMRVFVASSPQLANSKSRSLLNSVKR